MRGGDLWSRSSPDENMSSFAIVDRDDESLAEENKIGHSQKITFSDKVEFVS